MMMRILTADGLVEVNLPDAEDRSTVGRYWNAIGRYVRTGRTDHLEEFSFAEIGGGVVLETDPDAIDQFWFGGELDFLEVYA